ncbi:uncharacterized protein QC763_201330 [Podospora pseudopauciseta]|uniref:Uncharacterized protein n=1 Tax=Podospora pseudopauciseta TaxID=2093780 RepID=A0ABR0HMC8_9PEZI|nr:hypothetical protein QC763_201330 [Podospora pseudopauciseta]
MYGQSVHWRSTLNHDAEGDKDNRDEGRAPRQDYGHHQDEDEQQEEVEFASRIEEWRKQRAQRQHRDHQHNGQRYRRHREKSRQASSSPQPADSPSPEPLPGNASPPGRSTVDRLARKLSKQNLQHSNRVNAQSSMPMAPSPLQSMPPVVPETPSIAAETFTTPFPAHVEVDQQYQQPTSSQPPTILPDTAAEKPEDKRLDFKELRRHASARALQARLQAMIDNETQCNVRSEPMPPPPPPPPPAATIPRPWLAPPVGEPVIIEVDPDCAMPNWDNSLEVDENDTSDIALDGLVSSARHAHAPSGVRKQSIGGVALRYRLSVDAALRCQNVVRNRPRMRKRDKSRHGSTVSSAMTSAISSPVVGPTIPSSSSMPPPPPPYTQP